MSDNNEQADRLAEMLSQIPEGAVLHYMKGALETAVRNPTPLCGDDLVAPEDGGPPIVGLTPIQEVVNCERCLAILAKRAAANGPIPVVYDASKGHHGCSEDSACRDMPSVDIRAFEIEGEHYLHRDDVLSAIGTLFQATHALAHKAEEEGEDGMRPVYEQVAHGMNMVGGIIYNATLPHLSVDLDVPDDAESILAGWSEGEAAESPIDQMIREATEATAARKTEVNNRSEEDQ